VGKFQTTVRKCRTPENLFGRPVREAQRGVKSFQTTVREFQTTVRKFQTTVGRFQTTVRKVLTPLGRLRTTPSAALTVVRNVRTTGRSVHRRGAENAEGEEKDHQPRMKADARRCGAGRATCERMSRDGRPGPPGRIDNALARGDYYAIVGVRACFESTLRESAMKPTVRGLSFLILVCFSTVAALGAGVAFTPGQQESVNKITAKGGLVMQLASDSDLLVVNMSLGGKQTTDAEVAEVKNLPKVAQLNLANTAVTDGGLAAVSGLTDLTTLHLERTGVTDAGLANLKGLAKLEYLNLYGTGVTDGGIANLSGLKNLKRLYLWQTKVTDAGVNGLKKGTPALVVNRGEELAIVVKPVEAAPAASSSASDTASKPLNSKCPVSGKDVVLPNVLTHEGKLVGFCCDKCPVAFTKEPAKYAAAIKYDIAPPAAPATPEKKPDAKPADTKPAVKTADKKVAPAADVKPNDAAVKPAPAEDKKPSDAKPAEPKPADAKPVEKPAAAAAVAPAAASAVNTKCPVSDHDIEAGFTAVVDGKTVGFCCDKCMAKFNKDPKKFADKIVADAKK
jgi:YHS domain-containing protein